VRVLSGLRCGGTPCQTLWFWGFVPFWLVLGAAVGGYGSLVVWGVFSVMYADLLRVGCERGRPVRLSHCSRESVSGRRMIVCHADGSDGCLDFGCLDLVSAGLVGLTVG